MSIARPRIAAESAALVVLLAATWLVVGFSLREASSAAVSAGRTVFTVAGLAALVWLPGLRAADEAPGPRRVRWGPVAILGLTGVTAYVMLSTVAIALAGPALPSLIISLIPAVVLIAESVLHRTRPARTVVAGTILAVGGAVLYVLPRLGGAPGHNAALGTAAALGAMLSMAFYGVYFVAANRDDRSPMARRILPIFAVGSLPLVVWAAPDLADVSWSAVALLAGLGIVIYVPAYLLQHRLLLATGAHHTALLGLAVPPLVGVSSALLDLAGLPSPLQIAAMALTAAGMFLVIRRSVGDAARKMPSTPRERRRT